jgi:hypothetical protein
MSLHLSAQGFVSAEVADEDDKQIDDCLEHVNFLLVLFLNLHCCYGIF